MSHAEEILSAIMDSKPATAASLFDAAVKERIAAKLDDMRAEASNAMFGADNTETEES